MYGIMIIIIINRNLNGDSVSIKQTQSVK